MKKKTIMLSCIVAIAIATMVGKKTYESHAPKTGGLLLQNIEALSQGDITVVGCKPMKNATCYVFDGNGQLVDRRKNQYKGD